VQSDGCASPGSLAELRSIPTLLRSEMADSTVLRPVISAHLFVGITLVGPLAIKTASTGWRFFRYYTNNPAYRRHGPPQRASPGAGPAGPWPLRPLVRLILTRGAQHHNVAVAGSPILRRDSTALTT
jgi:hypothetical protein